MLLVFSRTKITYQCCDLDCLREFESELPRRFLDSYLCPECAAGFDELLLVLRGKGVRVEFEIVSKSEAIH